jgi:hypothetical protein
MKHTRRGILNLAIILSVVLVQLSTAARALADDSPPPEETPVVSPTDDPAAPEGAIDPFEAPPTEELAPTEELTPTEELAPTDELTPTEPAADPTEELTPEETGTAAPEETATPDPEETATPDPGETADEPDCIPADEVVAQEEGAAPGEALPVCEDPITGDLTVPVSDPMWCRYDAVPGSGLCTPSFATITELIAFLQANSATYFGNGSIYFQAGAYTGPETYIVIDYTVVLALGTLEILGGWDLDPADGYAGNTGTTTFTVPIEVIWDEDVSLEDIIITLPAGSPDSGLFVDGGGIITLDNVDASGGSSGAELDAAGDVFVTGGEFSDNTNYGLLIYANGNVTLTDVVAGENNTGIFVDNSIDPATGLPPVDPITGLAPTVIVTNIFADDNGWTGMDLRSAGNITVTGGHANGNIVGANLQTTAGAGNIFVDGTTFAGNTSVGLRAITGAGDITLDGVQTESGDEPGSFGDWVKSYGGGTITVIDGIFADAETGLFVVGTADVILNDVTADSNTGDGAVIESGWVFGCFGPDGIPVTVNSGLYQDNGGFGNVIYPGPNGSATLLAVVYGGNGSGESLVDLTKTCIPGGDETPSKPYQVVEVSGKGDDPVLPDCVNYSGAILIMPDQSQIKLFCPVTSQVTVATVAEKDLPGPLPKSVTLIAGLVVTTGEDASPIRLCFKIPAESAGKHFAIMFWDPIANGNLGAWIELPVNQFTNQVFPLHPDTPEDGMEIVEGVYQNGDSICVKVNFGGTFALVAR